MGGRSSSQRQEHEYQYPARADPKTIVPRLVMYIIQHTHKKPTLSHLIRDRETHHNIDREEAYT